MSSKLVAPSAPDALAGNNSAVSDAELDQLLEKIGLARFIGRVHSGLLPPDAAYAAIERHAAHEMNRPLVSQLLHALLGREDAYFLH